MPSRRPPRPCRRGARVASPRAWAGGACRLLLPAIPRTHSRQLDAGEDWTPRSSVQNSALKVVPGGMQRRRECRSCVRSSVGCDSARGLRSRCAPADLRHAKVSDGGSSGLRRSPTPALRLASAGQKPRSHGGQADGVAAWHGLPAAPAPPASLQPLTPGRRPPPHTHTQACLSLTALRLSMHRTTSRLC